MTEITDESTLENNEVFEDEENVAAGRRWDPLGEEKENDDSVFDDAIPSDRNGNDENSTSQIKQLESEQEILSTSLQALTSHFAQVQFRLRQIVDASPVERDDLLKNLEEFAFRGIPEITKLDPQEHEHLFKIMERQRSRQLELIDHLKRQLFNVEKFAYESGAAILPQSVLVEKQKVLIDELKNKLKLNVTDDDLPQLTVDDIRSQVDNALGEFVQPLKMKDTLVSQLKTQIVDLERFVAYLQCESAADLKAIKDGKNPEIAFQTYNSKMARSRKQSQSSSQCGQSSNERPKLTQPIDSNLSNKASSLLLKASTVLSMFAVTQLGCGSNRIQKNSLKRTTKGNHWGDLRAQLEVDVQEAISLVSSLEKMQMKDKAIPEDCTSESDDNSDYPSTNTKPYETTSSGSSSSTPKPTTSRQQRNKENIATLQAELTAFVRKHLAVTLQRLMQHGLRDDSKTTSSLVPFIGCMIPFQQPTHRQNDECEDGVNNQMHVWDLILEYYHIKNGDQFNDTPARKLSESFNLDIMGITSQSASNKHSMLTAIGSIIAIHAPYKRSQNSHFKAFVSAGLNSQKLTQWLNLVYQCPELIDQYYADWSYVAHTGFRDALRTIDRLSQYHFELPIDLAVRQFQNIKDVFM